MERQRRILITGGSGFIGTNAVEYFLKKGNSVVSVDINRPRSNGQIRVWRKCDILDKAQLRAEFQRFDPEWVLHLAARTDLAEKKDTTKYAANIDGVQNLIELIKESPEVQRVLFASTRMVCRIGYLPKSDIDYCPPNAYGESKVMGEGLVRAAGLRCGWIIARPTSIWGPWFDVPYKSFFKSIARGFYFHPADQDPRKSFGYVENTVFQIERLMASMSRDVDGRVFYLCDYEPLQLREWADLIRKEMGLPLIRSLPFPILRAAAILGDIASRLGFKNPPITSFRLSNLTTEMIYDVSRIESIIGPLPFSLQEGVIATVRWMRESGELPFRSPK